MFKSTKEIKAIEVTFVEQGEGVIGVSTNTLRISPEHLALLFATVDEFDGFTDPKGQEAFEELKRVFRVEELYEASRKS